MFRIQENASGNIHMKYVTAVFKGKPEDTVFRIVGKYVSSDASVEMQGVDLD